MQMVKSIMNGSPVPFGLVKSKRTPWTVEAGKFKSLPPVTKYILSIPLWSRFEERYEPLWDEMVTGKWRLILRFRYEQQEGFSVHTGWMRVVRKKVSNG